MYGELEQTHDGRWRLRFERTLAHSPEKVWRALTAPEHLAHWFPTTIDGERASGARLRFVFPKGQAPAFEGEMLAFAPPTLMELRWGADILRLEVRPSADGTVLTLLDTLDEVGKAARDGAGWHVCLDGLALHLDGAPSARGVDGRMEGRPPDIRRRLRPERGDDRTSRRARLRSAA